MTMTARSYRNRLNSDLDANLITKLFFSNVLSPRDINNGDCFRWAYLAWCLYPDVELWTNPNHAWVKYQDKFYDSETPNGVDDWTDLPTCAMWNKEPRQVSVEQFKSVWRYSHRGRKSPTWRVLDSQARRLLSIGIR